MDIEYSFFDCLKGEFEAEGLTRHDVAAEALFAARKGLDYLVKISGCEAKSDIYYLSDLGITSVVAPMVESGFAMQKYMEMLQEASFAHIGVTIETITAVANIDDIIKQGKALTELTIGRTDLTSSWGGDNVESSRTTDMTKAVAKKAKMSGLKVTMGGSISKYTRELLKTDAELRGLLDFIETRKVVMPVERFLDENALVHALKLEEVLLQRRVLESERTLPAVNARLASLTKRT